MYGVGARVSTSTPPLAESDPGTRFEYTLPAGAPFIGTYELQNIRPQTRSYQLVSLLDLEETPISLAGTTSVTHTLTVGPDETQYWRFGTRRLDGVRDLLLLLFWDPGVHSLDPRFRAATQGTYFSSTRTTLVAGPAAPRVRHPLASPVHREAEPSDTDPRRLSILSDGLLINRKADGSSVLWLKEAVEPSGRLEYYVHIANSGDHAREYGVVSFLDFRQVPLTPNGARVTYVRVGAHQVATLKAAVDVPPWPGVRELEAVAVMGPDAVMKPYQEAETDVLHSPRVALVVR